MLPRPQDVAPCTAMGLRRHMDGGIVQDYRRNMDSGRFRSRAVALIAAYAVAMQTLLSAFVPALPATAAASFAVLCSHDGADGSKQPLQHDPPCAAMCAAIAHGVAGPLPPDFVAGGGRACPSQCLVAVPKRHQRPASSARAAARLISDRFAAIGRAPKARFERAQGASEFGAMQ
jgi:hypothetical protein